MIQNSNLLFWQDFRYVSLKEDENFEAALSNKVITHAELNRRQVIQPLLNT